MIKYLKIFLLLLLITGSAVAYEYHMPVNIQCTTTPAVLMPGDEALLAIEMQNGAASYGAGKDSGSGSTAQSSLLSTPINKTVLKGTQYLKVLTADYNNLGMIGPNDKILAYYKIKASENITSGTYLLNFQVQGGYDMITINRNILVKVDPSPVSMAIIDSTSSSSPSSTPGRATIDLNVANPRENTLNAVTIVPSGQGLRFSPERYYIGTMDPDEVFTISFGVDYTDPQRSAHNPVNVSFVAEFKNGDTWHRSEAYKATFFSPLQNARPNNNLWPLAIGALVLLAAGGYLYRKMRLTKNGSQGKGPV